MSSGRLLPLCIRRQQTEKVRYKFEGVEVWLLWLVFHSMTRRREKEPIELYLGFDGRDRSQ